MAFKKSKQKRKTVKRRKSSKGRKSSKSRSSSKRRRNNAKLKERLNAFLSKFKKSKSGRRKKSAQRRRRVMMKKFRGVLLILAVLGVLGFGVYLVVGNVIALKLGTDEPVDPYLQGTGEDIIGLEGIPQFPRSKFLFGDHISEDEVRDFLAEDQSAYTIPLEADWTDVVEFYKRELKARGWEHVDSIDRSDQLRMYGEYWIKVEGAGEESGVDGNTESIETGQRNSDDESSGIESLNVVENTVDVESEDSNQTSSSDEAAVAESSNRNNKGRGLRIYTRLNDIWYQEITVNQARTGLADQVAQESELDFLISMSSGEQLPEELPWSLRFAPVWDFEIEESEFSGVKMIEFTNPETSSRLLIQPIAYVAGQDLESLGREFVKEGNIHRDEESQFEINGVSDLKVAEAEAVLMGLSSPEGLGSLCVVPNDENKMIYVIVTYGGETAFFDYVIENLELPKEEEED